MHTLFRHLCRFYTISAVLELNFVSEETKRLDLQIKVPHLSFKKLKVKAHTYIETHRRQDINSKK